MKLSTRGTFNCMIAIAIPFVGCCPLFGCATASDATKPAGPRDEPIIVTGSRLPTHDSTGPSLVKRVESIDWQTESIRTTVGRGGDSAR